MGTTRTFQHHDDVVALHGILTRAWAKAEPDHTVTQNPAAYSETFLDLARAAVDSGYRHPDSKQEWVVYNWANGTRYLVDGGTQENAEKEAALCDHDHQAQPAETARLLSNAFNHGRHKGVREAGDR
ncbi:hypothetical protein [Leifsonia sp. Leaf264]|uniref:hypothetical protein n=1 Tax=Leifsonia sp. Leaf264 TaxID=1736314 RepID=UPI0006F3D255|nr:hypothetical protein [Leifsonia sp. Leaf264]KQO98577.1 hypothetical protein ASF30_10980 [Leifsonia sp. Leaf264]